MTDFYYTYDSGNTGSSVAKRIYWDVNTKHLFVLLPSGNYAGYANVPAEVVNDLVASNSVGQVYNSDIKRKYTGFSTGNARLLKRQPDTARRVSVDAYGNTTTPAWATSTGFGTPVTPKKRYRVSGTVLRPTAVSEFVVADSLESAIQAFKDNNNGKGVTVTGVSEA